MFRDGVFISHSAVVCLNQLTAQQIVYDNENPQVTLQTFTATNTVDSQSGRGFNLPEVQREQGVF